MAVFSRAACTLTSLARLWCDARACQRHLKTLLPAPTLPVPALLLPTRPVQIYFPVRAFFPACA